MKKHSPENIHKEFTKRNLAGVALTKDRDAISNIIVERTWLADGDANKKTRIGPMLYNEAYLKVKKLWHDHSVDFKDSFDNGLALVGGFDAIEKINMPGANRFCGKNMVVCIRIEKNASIAKELRMGVAI